MVRLRRNRLTIADASKGDEHGQEAESVKEEISRHAEDRHGKAAERRPQNARHVESKAQANINNVLKQRKCPRSRMRSGVVRLVRFSLPRDTLVLVFQSRFF